jgi:hypothetical protein
MDVDTTGRAKDALLREAVGTLPAPELRDALDRAARPEYQASKAVRNALLALRRHHDPLPYLGRPQYRPTIPYLAAVVSDACLNRTIELLGDHSEEPSRRQLRDVLATVHGEYDDAVVAVMLAAVAWDDLPATRLCLDELAGDPRYGLTTAAVAAGGTAVADDRDGGSDTVEPTADDPGPVGG